MTAPTGTPRWGVVLVGAGVPLTTVVGGISLALRHLRTAERVGWEGLSFVIPDEAERAQVANSLQQSSTPEGVQVEFVASEQELPDREIVFVEGSALYKQGNLSSLALNSAVGGSTKIPADFRISDLSDIANATQFLYTQIRKSVEMDGVIAFYVMRPIARKITKLLLNTSVSPNQATLGALACGISAAVFAALGSPLFAIFAGLLYWFGGVIDCIDGELARLRLQSSKFGEWLDSMVDEFSTLALIIGIGVGLTRDGYGAHWQLAALAGATLAAITLGRMYTHLHKNQLMIDTAQFPWFYVDAGAPKSPASLLGKLIAFIGYFVRRDANLTIIAILLIANMRVVALCTMLAAFCAVTLLLIAHYLIMARRAA